MKSNHILTIMILLTSQIALGQIVIDSSQEHIIKYHYEKVISPEEFELFENQLLAQSNTTDDSLQIRNHVTKLRAIQHERVKNDTSQFCEIIFIGEPLNFTFQIAGDTIDCKKDSFKTVRIFDDFPHFESQYRIKRLKRTDHILQAKFISPDLNYHCDLDISYSTIRIENAVNIPMAIEITTTSDTNDGLPVPIQRVETTKGSISIKHQRSH